MCGHTRRMSKDVMYRHIDLYVNEYSVDLGPEGRHAVGVLFDRAAATDHPTGERRSVPAAVELVARAMICCNWLTPSVSAAGPGCRMIDDLIS